MGCCGSGSCKDNDENKNANKKHNITKQSEDKKIPKNRIQTKERELNSKRKNKIDQNQIKDSKYDTEFIEEALKTNNKLRLDHGAEKLELDEYLIHRAFILAKLLLIEGTYYNENICYKNGEELGMIQFIESKKFSGNILMNKWYEKKSDYDFQEPKVGECSEFTQMIWKSSKKFGINYYCIEETNEKKDDNKENNNDFDEVNTERINPMKVNKNSTLKYCYVALYYPPGNKPGEYKKNVLKKKAIPFTSASDNKFNKENREEIDKSNKKHQNRNESTLRENEEIRKNQNKSEDNRENQKHEKDKEEDVITIIKKGKGLPNEEY